MGNGIWVDPKAFSFTLQSGESKSWEWETSLNYLQIQPDQTILVQLNGDEECVFDVPADACQILDERDCNIFAVSVTNNGAQPAKVQVLIGIPSVSVSEKRRQGLAS
jgi:hypothetical protein